MKTRVVTHDEAEAAFSQEMKGDSFSYGDICDGRIVGIRLPERPAPGGSQGRGIMPLTYQVETNGDTRVVDTEEGPEVDEFKAFLYGTLPDRAIDEQLELWFEREPLTAEGDCGCGCGC